MPHSGARVLYPSAKTASGGAHVGNTVGGRTRQVHFTDDTTGRHHLYMARTRMGKSTLMQHVVLHKMREKAAGRNHDAIIVIDPHADLVHDLLEQVPEEIIDRVYLIDLADDTQAPGINLVDVKVFPDRDRTANSVVRVAKGMWEHWGSRMQSILEHVVKTLHEYNCHPDTKDDQPLTILDGQRLLADLEFRRQVLKRVDDPYVFAWWEEDPRGWTRDTRSNALAPVQTRLDYYSPPRRHVPSWASPAPPSTCGGSSRRWGALGVHLPGHDRPGRVRPGGGVPAQPGGRRDPRAGQSAARPAAGRQVVDEMQSLPGVDYESMLSELGKFGASFILATQSLAKLADLSPIMQDTLLANVGSLAVFQVSAADARDLIGELDRERLGEEDLVSLPAHHCYVRATVDGQREPTYYLELRKPGPGDPAVAERIRAAMADYTTPAETLASQDAEAHRRVQDFRDKLDQEDANSASGQQPGQAAWQRNRRRGRQRKEAAYRRRSGDLDQSGALVGGSE